MHATARSRVAITCWYGAAQSANCSLGGTCGESDASDSNQRTLLGAAAADMSRPMGCGNDSSTIVVPYPPGWPVTELLGLRALREAYRGGHKTPVEVVEEVFRRIDQRGEDHVWTSFLPREAVRARALDLASRMGSFDSLPLYGIPFGVKDNLDVEGLATSCGCASFRRNPARHATAVERAMAAGAILIGKQSLDQFATGLNGTRTIGPHPKNVFNGDVIPGGSSSGSGVSVAAGLVGFSLGSDTGGSGRVPAAMNNIVGVRPTVGLVSARGMVYNNQSFDCIPIFAGTVDDAYSVLDAIAGHDAEDPWSRNDSAEIMSNATFPEQFAFGFPDELEFFGDRESERLFNAAVARMEQIGGVGTSVNFSDFYEAGRLIFGSALLAERSANYGEMLWSGKNDLVPAVAAALESGFRYAGVDAFKAMYKLQALRAQFHRAVVGIDVLLTPTVPRPYFVEEMLSEPVERNNEVGYYTYGVGPLGFCAVAVPAALRSDGIPFGVSLVAPAGEDGRVGALARRFEAATGLRPGVDARSTTLSPRQRLST